MPEEIDKTILTPATAKEVLAGIEPLLKKLEGLTGHAVNIRYKLEAARDLAGTAAKSAIVNRQS
jgi:hypothetical protein